MQTISLNDGWTFWRSGEADGPSERVRLPHDAMIGERRSPDAPSGNHQSYFHGGVYRYERTLDVPRAWLEKRLILEFEGVQRKARVYVNGVEAAYHAYGYTGFSVPLEGIKEGANTIAVVADNSEQPNSRWYAGSGIYRPVWLHVAEPAGLALDAITVTTLSTEPPELRIQVACAEGCAAVPRIVVEGPDGVRMAEAEGADVTVKLPEAALWSVESPALHTVRASVALPDGRVDEQSIRFGIRVVALSEKGLLINGIPTKLRGGCIHSDNGILGVAEHPEAARRKVAQLKRWGFNAIRSSHNPISKAVLDACDELGMYVLDEFCDVWYEHKTRYDYASDFEANYEADIRAMIEKDRNRASVIFYSIGNENSEPASERGVQTAENLAALVRALDPTRPVTAGVNRSILWMTKNNMGVWEGDADPDESAESKAAGSTFYNLLFAQMGAVMDLAGAMPFVARASEPFMQALDVAGYNYGTTAYASELRKHPERLLLGTETLPYSLAATWRRVESEPRLLGDFMWTALDYLGEVSLASWTAETMTVQKPYPWLCADTGALDLVGSPTGEAAMAAVTWGAADEPLIYVRPANMPNPKKAPWRGTNSIPSWSWAGCEGTPTVVEVYTQERLVALYLNGRHVATRAVRDNHADFRVKYERGTLEAVTLSADGAETGRASLVSASDDLRLVLVPEPANPRDEIRFVALTIEDEAGIVESNADCEIKLTVESGELLAFGSVAVASERSYLEGRFPTRYGRALAVVRPAGEGTCTIRAEADGLGTAELTL